MNSEADVFVQDSPGTVLKSSKIVKNGQKLSKMESKIVKNGYIGYIVVYPVLES